MAETPNHGYNAPDRGTEDWHEPLNDNFEAFDTDIEIRDTASNRSDYDPKAGAKFLATDTGRVSIGDGSSWTPLASTGSDPAFTTLNSGGQNLGIGSDRHGVPLDIQGGNWNLSAHDGDVRIGDQDFRLAIGVSLGGAGRGTARLRAKGGVEKLNLGAGDRSMLVLHGEDANEILVRNSMQFDTPVSGGSRDPMMYMYPSGTANEDQPIIAHSPRFPGWGLYYNDRNDEFEFKANGNTSVRIDPFSGNINSSGAKNFVQSVDTDDGPKEVVYTASEAGTPHTEVSGVAELEDGRAVVDLPEHFGWVTTDEDPLMAQVTAHARERVHPQVTERSTRRIVIEDFEDPSASYEVSYTVTGTRKGFEDKEVVRDPAGSNDHDPSDEE